MVIGGVTRSGGSKYSSLEDVSAAVFERFVERFDHRSVDLALTNLYTASIQSLSWETPVQRESVRFGDVLVADINGLPLFLNEVIDSHAGI